MALNGNPSLLSELGAGRSAVIESMGDDEVSVRLMEMGCLPGSVVRVEKIALFGDPISISVNGCEIGLRKEEAAAVHVRALPH